MIKEQFGLCNSMVRIAEVVQGNGAIQNNLESIREAFIVADCCRKESRNDLAIAILNAVARLPLASVPEIRDQLTNQRSALSRADSTTVIGFNANRESDASEMPALFIRGLNIAGALARWASSGLRLRTRHEIDKRLAICQACPQLVDNHCRVCGCPCVESNQLLNKLALASEACPLGKWT